MTLPAYAHRRPTGIAWLGSLPDHWEVKRLRHIGKAVIGLTYDPVDVVDPESGVLVLRSSNVQSGHIDLRDTVFVRGAIPERLRTKIGDILICSRNGSRALIGKNALIDATSSGVTFGAFMTIFRSVYNEFLQYVFRSPLFEFQSGAFLTSTINQLTVDNLKNFEVPLPPIHEQRAIAAFLAGETARLDRLIEKRRRMIALLHEKRASLITHAVTRGLDPDAPLKDSGLKWLGRIPATWKAGQLRRFWSVTDCKHHTVPFTDEGQPVASIGELARHGFSLANAKMTTQEDFDFLRRGRIPKKGDLVYCRNASVGLVGYVDTDAPFALGQDVCLIAAAKSDCRYLYYVMVSKLIADQLAAQMVGATFKRINVEAIKEFFVPCPSPEEQCQIALHLDTVTQGVDRTLAVTELAIARLAEYRASLITAAVTGQIDVRGLVP